MDSWQAQMTHAQLVDALRLAARTAIDKGQSVLSELLTNAARVIEQYDREESLRGVD